jgi:hypothetical protein
MLQFTIGEDDWNELARLSKIARETPAFGLSSEQVLSGNDFASMALEDVHRKWREVGLRMGFDGSNVRPVDESRRIIEAQERTPGGVADEIC